jgi:hypothetical protein
MPVMLALLMCTSAYASDEVDKSVQPDTAKVTISVCGQVVDSKIKSLVERSDLIVVGTLVDIKRRAMLIRATSPISGTQFNQYYDIGRIAYTETLKYDEGGAFTKLFVCFPSDDKRDRERFARGSVNAHRDEGASGMWFLRRYGPMGMYLVPGLEEALTVEASDGWDEAIGLLAEQ